LSQDNETVSRSLQESIVTLLALRNDKPTKIISTLIDPVWFEFPYREIVVRCLEYWKQYGNAPLAHIEDIFDDILGNTEHRNFERYTKLFNNMLEEEPGQNSEFIKSRIYEFAERQILRKSIVEAAQILMKSENKDNIDKCKTILAKVTNFHRDYEDLGFTLSQTDRSLAFLDAQTENDKLFLGIKELDDEGICAVKKEMLLFIAPRGKGKSMFMDHVGLRAIGISPIWNALHMTLENSETNTAQRYIQSEFNLAKRDNLPFLTEFRREGDNVVEFSRYRNTARVIKPKPNQSFEDHLAEFKREFSEKIKTWGGHKNYNKFDHLRIKKFPTSQLSFEQYENFLDQLAEVCGFSPDIVLLDYPKLMDYIQFNDPRISLGLLFQKLRGSAEKRNYALVVVSQSNRIGEGAKLTRGIHVAEDITQMDTCDTAITYSQTDDERDLGLARLYVDKARNERGGFTVLISQDYATATFCLDSYLMKPSMKIDDLMRQAQNNPIVLNAAAAE
jgi:hypothetical protein